MKIFLFFIVKDKDLEIKRMIDEIDASCWRHSSYLLKNVACLKFATEFFSEVPKKAKVRGAMHKHI